MDLFDQEEKSSAKSAPPAATAPLAYRMAPATLDEYVGQEHIIGKGKLLRRAVEADRITSLILYGPPGTGKTALARVIANRTQAHFEWLNAAVAGIEDLRKIIQSAKARRSNGVRTVRFTGLTNCSRMCCCLMSRKAL